MELLRWLVRLLIYAAIGYVVFITERQIGACNEAQKVRPFTVPKGVLTHGEPDASS